MASTRKYAAVSIVSPGTCCKAAQALDGKLFLAGDAPGLPLIDCSEPDGCRCRYRKYDDRRHDDDDRRFHYSDSCASWFSGAERRASRGRRKDD